MRYFLPITFFILALAGAGCEKDETLPFSHPFQVLENTPDSAAYFTIPGTKSRDGSEFGIGVRVTDKKKWVIFLQGGGACYNMLTCMFNPTRYDESNFINDNMEQIMRTGSYFNIYDERNPCRDWSAIFVPYTSGDVYCGDRESYLFPFAEEPVVFQGYNNINKILDYIEPYLKSHGVEQILFTGHSAGGYGVLLNSMTLIDRFPGVDITVIDDSGPVFSDDQVFSPCLDSSFREIFNIPIPVGLETCCGTPENRLANAYEYASTKYPNAKFGLTISLEDENIRLMLGFGYDNCRGIPGPARIPAEEFKQALIDLRENILKPRTTWSTFYAQGDIHGTLINPDIYYNREADGVYLYQWTDSLINGARSLHLTE